MASLPGIWFTSVSGLPLSHTVTDTDKQAVQESRFPGARKLRWHRVKVSRDGLCSSPLCSLACGSVLSCWNQQRWRSRGRRLQRKRISSAGPQQPTVWLGSLCSMPQDTREIVLQTTALMQWAEQGERAGALNPRGRDTLHSVPGWKHGSHHGERTGLHLTQWKSHHREKMRVQRTDG